MNAKVKHCLQPVALPTFGSVALLILRVVVGIAFILHGWGKIQNPMAWMGPDAPVPGILQFLAAFAEFAGGIALILGLLTSLASLGLIITMSVAVFTHMIVRGDPFVSKGGGPSYELAVIYWAVAMLLIALGAGKFSADAKIFGQKKK